ncbi:helix-turn-helix domain-containing protein [Acidithiobacillus sp. AMEEHan]|uniref:helix-turn-helix domain-containing protein n=1 Tax=Acidithiobacillus sp. AMEEHan TaxID=2994951 RepID=UPI0027E5829C|nr:helix-turn-helix domain-containing protein [Acidithiobacillus sp. AMEEHan]
MDEEFTKLLTQLRSARIARGWELTEAAQKLHITSTQIAALEEGRFDELPGALFARGYLRNYARLLDLDADELLAAYDRYRGASGLQASKEVLPRSELPLLDYSGKTLFFSLLLALVLILLGWWLWGRGGPASSAPIATAASASAKPSAPQVVMSTPAESAAVTGSAFSLAATTTAGATTSATASTLSPQMRGLAFHFTGDCWVQVRDSSGTIVLSTLGRAGQELSVTQGQPPYRILVGKASAVQITYAGKAVALPANAMNVARVQVGSAPATAPSVSAKLAPSPSAAAQSRQSSRPLATTASSSGSAVASDISTFSEVAHATSVTHSAS